MNRFKFLTVFAVAARSATTLLAQAQKKEKAWENAQYSIAFANKK